jgi:hypothetical protein
LENCFITFGSKDFPYAFLNAIRSIRQDRSLQLLLYYFYTTLFVATASNSSLCTNVDHGPAFSGQFSLI